MSLGETTVVEASFLIVNARGLHARAATKLVQLASKFPCEVTLFGEDGEPVNGKSVMGVLLICGGKGTIVRVRADGPRAQECVDVLGGLIADKFGEGE